MPKKRRGEQMGRDRASSQGIGKRHMSRHKAGRQGNRASLEAILEELEGVKEELEGVKENFWRLEKQNEIIIKQLDKLKERPDDASLARRSELHESSQLRLRITSTVNSVVYKRRPIETNHGDYVVVTMFDGTDQIAPDHRLSSAEVELVILNGAFNGAAEERWSKQEFEDQIFDNLIEGKSGTGKMNQKKKKDNQGCQPMIKNSIFKLTSGSCSHFGACIMGNSNRGEFRLGVRLVGHSTERVLEGISNPFKVQEYKTKGNAKHDIPSVDSEIWRLRRIARNSEACSEIEEQGIDTVGRLLISYHENKQNLLEILRGSYHRNVDVDAIIDHAKKCEDGLCSYTMDGITLLFNQVETLVGVQVSDCYYRFSVLQESDKDKVRKYESYAREHKVAWRLDYKMEHDRPKPWQPKGSNLFIEKHIEREGSSVPTSAQMQEEAQATIRRDEKGSIQDRQDSSDRRAAERVQMMRPSAQASIPNAHNVQGEAGPGRANTGEPSTERNSFMAYVPATYDRTGSLLNHWQPQGYPLLNHLQHPPFDCQPSVDHGGDGQFTYTDEDTGLPTPVREQYITPGFGPWHPGFAAYAGQSSSGFAAVPYIQGQSSFGFTGTPSVQGHSSFARPELQASYLGGEQLGSEFIRSVIHEFIEDSPQFDMPQQDTIDAYQTQLTNVFLSTRHTQWSPYPL